MGFRFRKSINIAPGIKLNLSKSSAGITVGGKGAKTTINTSGTITTSAGVPGTGVYWSESSKISKAQQKVGNETSELEFENNCVEKPFLFNEKAVKRMNLELFTVYTNEVLAWAKTLTPEDNPQDIEEARAAIALINKEIERRNKKPESTPLGIAIGAIVGFLGVLITIKTLWGLVLVGIGLAWLLTQYEFSK